MNALKQQNTIFKFIFILLGLFYTFVLKEKGIVILIFINTALFFFDLNLFKVWLKTLNKASSFVMSYLVFALIIDIDFSVQISFLLRILYLLQLSVYLTQTSDLHQSINDLRFLIKYPVIYELFYFLIALTSSMTILSHIWNKQIAHFNKEKFQVLNYLNVLINCMEEGISKLSVIEKQVNRIIKSSSQDKIDLISPANLLLAYQFTVYVLIISL